VETKAPTGTTAGWGGMFATATDSWKCDTCMVQNKLSDNKCAACEMPRLGAESSQSGGEKKSTITGAGSGASIGAIGFSFVGDVSTASRRQPLLPCQDSPRVAPIAAPPPRRNHHRRCRVVPRVTLVTFDDQVSSKFYNPHDPPCFLFDEQPTSQEVDVTDTSSGDDKKEPRRCKWARRPTWKKRSGGV
jgi:hypothetical protein